MRSSREADVHFLTVGWTTCSCFPALFSCSAFLSTHPLLLQVHCSWRYFSSCAAFLWFTLISSIYMQFLFFALKLFYFLKHLHLGSFSHFSGTMFLAIFSQLPCHYLLPTLSVGKIICGPWNPEQQRKPKYLLLFPLHFLLYDDRDSE